MREKLIRALRRLDAVERGAAHDTPLHAADARAKLIVTAVYLTAMLSVPLGRLSELLLYTLFPICWAARGGFSYPRLLRRSLCVLPFLIFVGIFNLLGDRTPAFRIGTLTVTAGAVTFLAITVRGLLSVQALLLLVESTGFCRLCHALQRLGMPGRFPTLLLLVYRYTYILLEESVRLSMARDARSFGRRSYPLHIWSGLIVQLLLGTLLRAERIGRAMAARGFTGRIPRGLYPAPRWQRRDTLFLAGWSSALLLLRLLAPAEPLTHWITS